MPTPRRQPPTTDYCGLTLVLSNPSRFDTDQLLSATGGSAVMDALRPYSRQSMDIRLWQEQTPLLPNTRCVLLFGEMAMHNWCPETRTNTLNEQRGSLIRVQGIPAIATYNPQEATDVQDYEKQKNALARQQSLWREKIEDEEEGDEKRRHGATAPKNYGFWLDMDCRKAARIVQHPDIVNEQKEPTYILQPSSEQILEALDRKGECLFFDMETDMDQNILCVAFGFSLDEPIYVVPFLDTNYQPAYAKLPYIYRAFARSLRDNTAVAHNGAGYDFLVLARKYDIPIGPSVYDTMLAQHRCYPQVEKSLGHAVSLWTYEPYHKDEADFSYRSQAAAERLYRYCGKDVYSMMLVKRGIDKHQDRLPGLKESIEQVNSAIKPYLTAMIMGVKLDLDEIIRRTTARDKEATQLMRVMRILTGPDVPPLISNQKCVNYFHDCMNYPVQEWTSTGNPSLSRKALLKLRLWALREFEGKQTNPVLDLLIQYREAAKEASMLAFEHYIPAPEAAPRTTTAIQLAGTYTFRLASKKFSLSGHKEDKVGGNLQNIEAETRQCYVPDDGCEFLSVDQAGAEALIVAYLCPAGAYRALFENNVKVHCFIALHAFPRVWAKMFGASTIAEAINSSPADLVKLAVWPDLNKAIKNSDDNPPRERYYYIAKMIAHSSAYGAKWPTFQLNVLEKSRGALAFTAKESREFVSMYHSLFPEIRMWHEQVRYQVVSTGYLFNLFGYPCHFADNKTIMKEKEWYAFVPQSTVGTITNKAVTAFYEYAEAQKKSWDILINTHDGILVQVPGKDKREAGQKLVEFITPSFTSPYDGSKFQMKAEIKSGLNWAPRKEFKDGRIINPDGLRDMKL